jgi:hypothetical protein
MSGKEGFARIAGIVALGGAFYTATYITSYPGGAPAYAVLGLLAGTAGGFLALAAPRSRNALTVAAVLLGFAFTGAVIHSGAAFGPAFVLMIMAARWAARRDPFEFLQRTTTERTLGSGSFGSLRQVESGAEPVVTIPEAEDVVAIPETGSDRSTLAGDGLAQAGPPGVIGLLGQPGRRGLSGGFRQT